MIYSYGVSLPGTHHIKNDIVCQDSLKIVKIGKDIAIAAVADGLGSAAHSDAGSKIAVAVSVELCQKHITEITSNGKKKAQAEQVLDIIRASFHAAHRAVEMEANSKDRSHVLYDTTLTLAVLVRDTLHYGHSGDSGIIALTTLGTYQKVTVQQRDDQGRVFPLFFSDKWEFAEYEHKVSAVLLATDGMLETFFPMYIKNHPVNIHVSLAQFFMDYRSLRIVKLGQEVVQARIKEFMENIPDEHVNDDKTVTVLVNPSVKTKKQPKEYYQEPDWAALKKRHDDEWKRAAYPGLFRDAGMPSQQEPALNQTKPNPFATMNESGFYESPRNRRKISKPAPRKSIKLYFALFGMFVICFSVIATIIALFFLHEQEGEPPNEPNHEIETTHGDMDSGEVDENESD